MSAITINGASVAIATITIPYYGAWSADVTLPVDAPLASSVALVVGDMTLRGTVVRQASFNGDMTARIVGGAAGWRKELPPKGYAHIVGVQMSTLLKDAADESGETIDVDSDRVVGIRWGRERGRGESLLRMLGVEWWIDNDGVTQTKPRDGAKISNPFTVLSYSGAQGSFEVATEAISQWTPGRTFSAPTVPDTQTISSVTIHSGNDGKLRLHVLNTDGANERLRSDLRSVIRAETPSLSYAGVWEYEIAPNPLALGLVSTVDCTPTDPRMPPLTSVPIVGMGIVAAPATGTKCRIQFVNNDPSRPECVSLESTSEHLMTVEAGVLMIYNVFASLALVNLGPWIGVAMQPLLTPAILAALAAQSIPAPPGLIAQVAAAAAQTAVITAGTAPANTIGPFAAAVSALPTKILDVSGLFPGIGVPNGG